MRTLAFLAALIIVGPTWANEPVSPSPLCTNITSAIGMHPKESLMRFGAPERYQEIEVENLQVPDTQDFDAVLHYQNGSVVFRYFSYSEQYVLASAALSVQQFNNDDLGRLVPGDIETLVKKWGGPDEQTRRHARYYCTFELLEWVDFKLDADKIIGLSYSGYVD